MAQENDDDDSSANDDNIEGWVDEVQALTAEERADLEESIRPVKKMLVQVTSVHRMCDLMSPMS